MMFSCPSSNGGSSSGDGGDGGDGGGCSNDVHLQMPAGITH
ncbi:MAG: hypothetical protein WAZ77_02635 [Candidatus Nitrosopolaris sp.]